jgi:hypothetical protein
MFRPRFIYIYIYIYRERERERERENTEKRRGENVIVGEEKKKSGFLDFLTKIHLDWSCFEI